MGCVESRVGNVQEVGPRNVTPDVPITFLPTEPRSVELLTPPLHTFEPVERRSRPFSWTRHLGPSGRWEVLSSGLWAILVCKAPENFWRDGRCRLTYSPS